jgi:hypothetical protein
MYFVSSHDASQRENGNAIIKTDIIRTTENVHTPKGG